MIEPNLPLHPLSRRRFVQMLGLGGAAAALAACGSGGGNAATPTGSGAAPAGTAATSGGAPTPLASGAGPNDQGPNSGITTGPPGPGSFKIGKPGGQVVTGWTSEANSYDAALGYDLQSWEAICCLLYTPLYQFKGQFGGAAPSAAAGMPTVSADARTYTIKLRPDVKFHNGRTVVADDYVYALTRVLDPKVASWASSYLLSIKGANAYNTGKAKSVAGLSAVDDTTLKIELEAPDILLMTTLCLPFCAAVPKEAVEKLGKKFSHTPVGNGPFKITSYDSAAQKAVFARNEDFFYKGVPFLDNVEYRWGIDGSLQFLQLKKGDLDVLGEGLGHTAAAQLAANKTERDKYEIPVPLNGLLYIAPNVKVSPLGDVRVRQALNWATNRKQLTGFLSGEATPWGKAFPAHEADYTSVVEPYGYDLDKARALLKAAGHTSLNLSFYVSSDDDVWTTASQVLQQQWAQIGVKLTLKKMGSNAFWTAVGKGHGDMYGNSMYQVQPSALDIIIPNFTTGASSNYYGYSNPKVDALVKQAQQAPTMAASNKILAQVEKGLTEDAAAIFVGNLEFLAARTPRVHNYYMRGETGSYYDRMWV